MEPIPGMSSLKYFLPRILYHKVTTCWNIFDQCENWKHGIPKLSLLYCCCKIRFTKDKILLTFAYICILTFLLVYANFKKYFYL
jgi:hypothetical protein